MMRTLLEALIGKHNANNAHRARLDKVLRKFTKSDLDTGDLVILEDKSIGMFISGKDINSSVLFVDNQYICKNGIFIFPDWYVNDRFEFSNIDDYTNDLQIISFTSSISSDELGVKYIIKGIIDPNLKKNKSKCWKFLKDTSNYDEDLPDDVLEFIGLI